LAIAAAMIASVLPTVVLNNVIGTQVRKDLMPILGLLLAAVFMLVVGLVDDIRGLRARHKLLAQLIAATALCVSGVRIESLAVEGLFRIEFTWLSWPLTIFWVVGITNAVNLIDGLDGLAVGICAIACAVVAAFAVYMGDRILAVTMLALLGALTGFLRYNFNPAKVFLGDCGSLFLGFMLAGASVLGSGRKAGIVGLGLPILAMGIPIFDTLYTMLRRLLQRRSPFAADRQHIHHRLIKAGLHQRQVVFALWGATALTAGLGMLMLVTSGTGALIVFGCVLLLLVLFLRTVGGIHLRGTLKAFRRIVKLSRQAGQNKQIWEEAQLRLREACSITDRWRVIAETAEKMGAVRVRIVRQDRHGTMRTVLHHGSKQLCQEVTTACLTIPLPRWIAGKGLQAELDVRTEESLESLGKQLALLGRLIDEGVVHQGSSAKAGKNENEFDRMVA